MNNPTIVITACHLPIEKSRSRATAIGNTTTNWVPLSIIWTEKEIEKQTEMRHAMLTAATTTTTTTLASKQRKTVVVMKLTKMWLYKARDLSVYQAKNNI